jgi:hypothetical protein
VDSLPSLQISKMAKKQRQPTAKLASGLPVAPWIYINNSINDSVNTSADYAAAVSSLIPHSHTFSPADWYHEVPEHHAISILTSSYTFAYSTACAAREIHTKALKRGCNMASIALCNDTTFKDFSEANWPVNHITINIGNLSIEEAAKKIVRWLCEFHRHQT